MTTFILAFVVLLLVITAMSVGVIFANKPIKGSCGGMAALGLETECDVCGGDKTKCDKEDVADDDSLVKDDAFYDAAKK
ncbi:MAG: hypothetical protein ACI93R_000455 [Flavobacteriales bacterium]|jgi:hypothetical protein